MLNILVVSIFRYLENLQRILFWAFKLENKQFAKVLEQRTLDFAVATIKLCASLPIKSEGNIVKHQLIKAATSVGANYREANRSESRADFIHKISICAKEASEAQYWFEIIKEVKLLPPEKLTQIYHECSEILAILTSVPKKLKSKK